MPAVADNLPRAARAVDRSTERLLRAHGVAVVVTRGEEELGCERAIPATRLSGGGRGSEVAVSSADLDWVVRASEYTLDGAPTEPRKRDRIRWRQPGGRVLVYLVVGTSDDRESDTSDAYGLRLRVHSRLEKTLVDDAESHGDGD